MARAKSENERWDRWNREQTWAQYNPIEEDNY